MKKIKVIDPRYSDAELEIFMIEDEDDLIIAVPGDSFSVRLKNKKVEERDFRNLSQTFSNEIKKIIEENL